MTKKPAKKAAPKANPLFVAEPRSFRVGGAIRVSKAWHEKDEGEGVCGELIVLCLGAGVLYLGQRCVRLCMQAGFLPHVIPVL